MLINGEKFACEACVRGHRVSSCHHQDRPLVHVNKKGRPVSQCQHCRGLRKSRSQHVKCECHDKTHTKDNCPHEKIDGEHDEQTCCCGHGSRCTCALKKEPNLDTVPEDIPQLIQPKEQHQKQWHNKNSHDPKTTIFTNGHHKPVHKFNDAHNQLGAPYKIPSRTNSLQGHRESAHRSTDNLLLTKNAKPFHESPLHNSITEAMQIMERRARSEHNSPILGPVKPVRNSPLQDFKIPSFDPNAYAYSPFGAETPPTQLNGIMNSQNPSQQDLTLPEQFPDNWFMSYEQAHDYDPAPAWARYNDASTMDWMNLTSDPLTSNNGFYNLNNPNRDLSPYMQTQQTTYQTSPLELAKQINRVGIATSSGEPSEAGDPSPRSNNNGWGNERPTSSGMLNAGETLLDYSSAGGDDMSERHRLSSASSYFGTPQASNLSPGQTPSFDIDEVIKQTEAETRRMQLQQQMASMQVNPHDTEIPSRLSSVSRGMTPSISTPGSTGSPEHGYTIKEAQRFAHMDSISGESATSSKPVMSPPCIDDVAWSQAPDMEHPELVLDDERDDEDWVR